MSDGVDVVARLIDLSPEVLAGVPEEETFIRICEQHKAVCVEKGDRIICKLAPGSFHEVKHWLVVDRRKMRIVQRGEDEGADDSQRAESVTLRETTTHSVTRKVQVERKSESPKPPVPKSITIPRRKVTVIFTQEQEQEIQRLWAASETRPTLTELAKRFNCSIPTIKRVLNARPARRPPTEQVALARLDGSPTTKKARAVRESALATVVAMDRYLLAEELLIKVPEHYVGIANHLLEECAAQPSVARTKVQAAVATLLFWDDFWTTIGVAGASNPIANAYKGDGESDSHDFMGQAADAIMGKDAERPWIKRTKPKVAKESA